MPTSLAARPSSFIDSPLYWALWLLPLLILTADFIRTRRQRQFNPVVVRRSQAAQQAVQQLQASNDPHTAVHQALTHYLSLKLDQPVTGLTQTHLRQLLQKQGLAATAAEQVALLLNWSETGRFAPVNSDIQASEAMSQTQQVIAEMEKVL